MNMKKRQPQISRQTRSWFLGGLLLGILLLFGNGQSLAQTPNQPTPIAPLSPVIAELSQLLNNHAAQNIAIRGVNYVHPFNADVKLCPDLHFGSDFLCPWNLNIIGNDLQQLEIRGVNTIRIFLNYYVFGGARENDPNYNLDKPLAHLDAFIAEANRHNILVMPVLLSKYPQNAFAPEFFEKALSLHVRPVVAHLAKHPGVLAWDLFNEIDIGSPVDERCWDWANADFPLCHQMANQRILFLNVMRDEIKQLDSLHPLTASLAFAKNYFEPAGVYAVRLADLIDFYAFHYYDNEPFACGRYQAHWYYGKGFPADLYKAVNELKALKLEKPIVITELGFPTGKGTTRTMADLHRDLTTANQLLQAKEIAGLMLWPFQAEPTDLLGDLFW